MLAKQASVWADSLRCPGKYVLCVHIVQNVQNVQNVQRNAMPVRLGWLFPKAASPLACSRHIALPRFGGRFDG